jgi:hypothetical protein
LFIQSWIKSTIHRVTSQWKTLTEITGPSQRLPDSETRKIDVLHGVTLRA